MKSRINMRIRTWRKKWWDRNKKYLRADSYGWDGINFGDEHDINDYGNDEGDEEDDYNHDDNYCDCNYYIGMAMIILL